MPAAARAQCQTPPAAVAQVPPDQSRIPHYVHLLQDNQARSSWLAFYPAWEQFVWTHEQAACLPNASRLGPGLAIACHSGGLFAPTGLVLLDWLPDVLYNVPAIVWLQPGAPVALAPGHPLCDFLVAEPTAPGNWTAALSEFLRASNETTATNAFKPAARLYLGGAASPEIWLSTTFVPAMTTTTTGPAAAPADIQNQIFFTVLVVLALLCLVLWVFVEHKEKQNS